MAIICKPRCKVCNEDRRAEIEEFVRAHKPGNSWQTMSGLVYKEFDLKIGPSSIWNHMRLHCDIKDDALEAYAKARMKDTWEDRHSVLNGDPVLMEAYRQESVQAAKVHIANHVAEIKKLDEMLRRDFDLYIQTADLIATALKAKRVPDRELIQLLKTLNGNLIACMKARMELLGEDAASRVADSLETWVDLVNLVE